MGGVYGNGQFRLAAIDPAQLTFTHITDAAAVESPLAVDTSLTEVYWNSLNGQPLPATLREAREYADRLEERYGVTILLSAQAWRPVTPCGTPPSPPPTVAAGGRTPRHRPDAGSAGSDAGPVSGRLLPSDEKHHEEGGVRFMPVGHIENAVNAIGLTYETYGWQNIYIDVTIDAFDGR